MKALRWLSRRRQAEPAAAAEPAPDDLARARRQREQARRDRLAQSMANAYWGPALTKNDAARLMREEAIRLSRRQHGGR